MRQTLILVVLAGLYAGQLSAQEKEAAMTAFKLSSSAFGQNQSIPAKYSCEGEDVSPPLAWEGAPAGAKSFALICDDPDAPGGNWVHWVIWNVPGTALGLPANVAKTETVAALGGARQGLNGWPKLGYNGPCPPRGLHHYHFKLYALDAVLELPPKAGKRQLEDAMKGHILGQTELVGTYQRK